MASKSSEHANKIEIPGPKTPTTAEGKKISSTTSQLPSPPQIRRTEKICHIREGTATTLSPTPFSLNTTTRPQEEKMQTPSTMSRGKNKKSQHQRNHRAPFLPPAISTPTQAPKPPRVIAPSALSGQEGPRRHLKDTPSCPPGSQPKYPGVAQEWSPIREPSRGKAAILVLRVNPRAYFESSSLLPPTGTHGDNQPTNQPSKLLFQGRRLELEDTPRLPVVSGATRSLSTPLIPDSLSSQLVDSPCCAGLQAGPSDDLPITPGKNITRSTNSDLRDHQEKLSKLKDCSKRLGRSLQREALCVPSQKPTCPLRPLYP